MSIQIDNTNYEAFYLDYLEGNLSGDALAAFEAFLLEHPELVVDELMPALEPEADSSYDPIRKLSLKHGIDMNDLNAGSVDFFLIAREEGLLTAEQEAHLNHWIEANAHYRRDAELYALVQLEADRTEVFDRKDSLKKSGGRVVPMWWTGAAVAAGLALIITIGLNTGGNDTTGNTVADNRSHIEQTDPKNDNGSQSAGKTNDQSHNKPRKNGSRTNAAPQQQKQVQPGDQQKAPGKRRPAYQPNNILLQETVIASLEKRRPELTTGPKTVVPMPKIAQPETNPVANETPETAIAWVPVDEMKNPIQPVTKSLSNTLNTPVDFRTAKASKRKGGGFYLKIGKLEVSHQSGQSASLY
jgi:hypothetical protein